MISAKFGNKKFQVTSKIIYTPENISFGEELEVEEKEVKGKKPTISFKGIKLQEISLKVRLDSRFCTIDTEIRYWQSILTKKKSDFFYVGATKIGKFYLTKYNVDDIQVNKNGKYRVAIIELSFTEDGAYTNSTKYKTPKKKVKKKTFKIGTKIKPKKGTRWYYTADGALKKKGKSGKAWQQTLKVSYIYKNGKAINPQGLGWMRPEDVDIV